MEKNDYYWWDLKQKNQDEILSIFENDKDNRPWCRLFLDDPPLCPGNLNSKCRIGFVPYSECLTDRFFYLKKNKTMETVASGGITTQFHIEDIDNDLPQGWQGAIRKSYEDHQKGLEPNTLVALLAFTSPRFRGKGLAGKTLDYMCDKGKKRGYSKLLIPALPPSQFEKEKTSFSMGDIAVLEREDGKPYDYWVRLHVNKGAKVIGTEERSHRFILNFKDFSQYVSSKPITSSGKHLVNFDLDKGLGANGKNMWCYVYADKEKDIITFEWGCVWICYYL